MYNLIFVNEAFLSRKNSPGRFVQANVSFGKYELEIDNARLTFFVIKKLNAAKFLTK